MSKNYPTPAEQDQNLKDGNHVALVRRRCPVLGTDHDAEIILHTRFGDVKNMHGKVVGWLDKPCEEAVAKYGLGPDGNVALCGLRKYADGEAVTAVVAVPQATFADMCNGNAQHIATAKKHLFIMTDAELVEKYVDECEAAQKAKALLDQPVVEDFVIDKTPDPELGTTDPES